MDLGSREEEKILSPVLRCGVRREEEIGARLSNEAYMNSTDLIDNPETDMSAMRFCRAGAALRAKKKGSARGESGALRRTGRGPARRERSGRKGGRRNTRCDEGHIGVPIRFANPAGVMSAMRNVHGA